MNQNSIDFRKLNIMTDDLGNVTNSQEIIDYLKDVTLDDESFEYMNSLLNRIKFGELENIDSLTETLGSIFSGKNYFPEIVKNAIECGENLENRYWCELTEKELTVAIMLGRGYSVKEIAIEIKSSSHNISNYIHYIRRKIGSKSDADFKEIYEEMLNRVLGGWNC